MLAMASQTKKPHADIFEWHIGEVAWQGFAGSAQVSRPLNQAMLSSSERRLIFAFLRSMLFCALALFLAAASFRSESEVNYARQEQAVERSLLAEVDAWRKNNRDLLADTIDPAHVETWGPTWRKYWRGSTRERQSLALEIIHIESAQLATGTGDSTREYIFAEVADRQPPRDWWLVSPTRETRVYTQAATPDGRWVRTIPPDSYWGQSQRLDTEHVRFEYYERDESLVAVVAPDIEEHYKRLFDLLALEPLNEQIKFTVRILPHPRQGRGGRSTVVFMTTPMLSAKPLHMSEEEYVERYVVHQLTALAVNRVARWRGSADNLLWSSVMWALRNQLEAELLGSDSPWFMEHEATFAEYGKLMHPMSLEAITEIRKPKLERDSRHIYWQQIGAELMIRYAIESYGLETTVGIITQFNQTRNWDQLISATFGVSLEEFEAGFAAYVKQRYEWSDTDLASSNNLN